MANSLALFADTSFLYALVDPADRHHKVCSALLGQAEDEIRLIITTDFILAESHALLLSRLGGRAALTWLRQIRDLGCVERVTEADEESALQLLSRYDDKDFSFTDATSFAVMERLGITTALSLDVHFVQYGRFLVLPLEGDRLPIA